MIFSPCSPVVSGTTLRIPSNGSISSKLADTLELVALEKADQSLLDRYERRRRALNVEFVQQTTIANKKTLEERDPKIRRSNLEALRAIVEDRTRHKQFLMRASLIESVRK